MTEINRNFHRPLKIAIYSGELPSTTFVENLIKGIAKEHRVLVFGAKKTKFKYRSKNVLVYPNPKSKIHLAIINVIRTLKLLISKPKDVRLLFQTIKGYSSMYEKWMRYSRLLPIILHRPDIIHLQWVKDIEHFSILKTEFGIKLVVSFLGTHLNISPITNKRLDAVYKKHLPLADGYHSISHSLIKDALKYNIQKGRIVHIPTILNPELLRIKVDNKKNNECLKLLSVGRFHWVKGFEYSLMALRELKLKGMVCTYTIIAQGKVPEHIQFLIKQLALEKHVVIRGAIKPQKKLFEVMLEYDVLVMPSVSEGIANVVLEAMALEIPVVSTDCGGMSEVVKHKETGWLVPTRNPKAIADAVVDIGQTNKKDLQQITANARQLVIAEFDPAINSSKYMTFYKSVLTY